MSGIDPDSGDTELEPPVKEANEAEPELPLEESNRGNAGEASKPRSKSGADILIELAGEADLFPHATMTRTPT